ncbi:glycosyltransferase family 4 protein [Pseudochelatococcus contaminans]|uniref:Glycosyltransferase involved in cell wall biosynthesis n=1 Tax=Pseudochelatococcus contaminans TaxID=1538103 RepID=A0A7W6EFD1_9HYPH|nr:glycosyltransferase family 4 protein [Pseudochelatococcus contaminans]MBB3808670.1 glycosyltransferase involved in cell wall biosynthesis [Pseudochelatococcus contaminans]
MRPRASEAAPTGHALPRGSQPLRGRTVLQIVPDLDAGGAERTTVDIAAGLAEAGARALVATEGGRLVGELQAMGGIWVPFPARTKNPLAMTMNVGKLMSICRREGVDLIHARSRAPAWVALIAARTLKLPFVTTYHGSYSGKSSAKVFYNSVMARGDVVIANSRYTAGLIEAAHPVSLGRIKVVHRGTDLSRYRPDKVEPDRVDALRKTWNVAPYQRIVLLAARLTAWKGQRVLIEAANLLHKQGLQDVVFILAGDPQGRDGYVRQLDKDITDKGLTGVVRRVGHCTDMPAALLASAIVVVPSIEPEAFGRVAVEAQAMGTPAIVSDLGAVPETVLGPPEVPVSERTGWRTPPGDAEALADAINEVFALGASARQALTTRARRHVEAHFSLEYMVNETLDVYGHLLGGRAAPPKQ